MDVTPINSSNKDVFPSPFLTRRRRLYPGGPLVSPFGFGGYRVGTSDFYHPQRSRNALIHAFLQGVNLVDTSCNYAFGESEVLIGEVMSSLVQAGKLKRDDLIICTKVGYIQGQDIASLMSQSDLNKQFPNIVQFGKEMWYDISPEWITHSLENSLKRLGQSKIDVLLLHNPEYLLKFDELQDIPQETAHEKFYQKIKDAFLCLEKLVSLGKIGAYGISSNVFTAGEDEYTRVSIEKCLAVARIISEKHHFKIVQTPLNWIESAALLQEQENSGKSFITYAKDQGLGVLVNRPFNAMLNNALLRLTRPQISDQDKAQWTPGHQKGYENWSRLAQDLEGMAHQILGDTPGYQGATLSQLVAATLTWIPGVSSVLTGMRQVQYVDEMKDTLRLPFLPNASKIIQDIYENLEFHDGKPR